MITQAKIYLNTDTELHTNMSSLMQGIIMEQVPQEFARSEHISAARSYSQYLVRENGQWIWVINTLSAAARHNIIDRITALEELYIRNKDIHVRIERTELKATGFDRLIEENYNGQQKAGEYIRIDFITPTAFKSKGEYINYPSVRLLLTSLINKYEAAADGIWLGDENVLDILEEGISIASYDLHSTLFHLEGVRIPAFAGTLTLRVRGNENMVSMVSMLAEFAQYSGAGIKCAIGMGAVKTDRQSGRLYIRKHSRR